MGLFGQQADPGSWTAWERKPEAPDVSALFKQNWNDAVNAGNWDAHIVNYHNAFDEVNDRIKGATGEVLDNPMSAGQGPLAAFEALPAFSRQAMSELSPVKAWSAKIDELRQKHPDALDWDAVSQEPHRMAWERMKAVREKTNEMSRAAGLAEGADVPLIGSIPYVGPAIGSVPALLYNAVRHPLYTGAELAGSFGGQMTSPLDATVNLLSFGAGGAAKSIIKNAMLNASVNAAGQAILSAPKQLSYRDAGLPWGFEQWANEVAGAAGAGFAIDAAIRGPSREILRRYGRDVAPGELFSRNTERAGFFTDLPEDLNLPTAPKAREAIDPELYKRAEADDPAALRELATKTGAIEDPAVKGAIEHIELGGAVDEAITKFFRDNGIDNGEGMRTLADAMSGRYDYLRQPEPVRQAEAPLMHREAMDLMTKQADAVEQVLGGLDRRIADQVQRGLEAGLPRIVEAVRETLAGVGAKNPDRAPAAILKAVERIAQDMGGPDRFADLISIHTGRDPMETAIAMRRSPDLVDSNVRMDNDFMRGARALSRLDDDAFTMIGEVAPAVAAVVSDLVQPGAHARVMADLKKGGIQSAAEAKAAIPVLLPREKPDAPLHGGSKIDDPAGPEAKAQTERLMQDHAEAVKEAMAPIKEREKLESQIEDLKGELAKLEEKAAKSGDPMAAIADKQIDERAKLREQLHEAEAQLAALKPSIEQRPMTLAEHIMTHAAIQRGRDVQRALAETILFANRILPDGTKLELTPEELTYAGRTLDATSDMATGAIKLGTYALDPGARLGHEAVHTLVTLGHLSPDEVKLLADAARKEGVKFDEAAYREAYKDRANLDTLIDEEAAAHYVEARVKSKEPQVQSIADRINALIERIRNALNGYGFKTAEDVRDAILRGDVARRQAVQGWMRQEDLTAMVTRVSRAEPDAMAALSDRDTGQSMRRDLDALGFYSQALEAARGLKQAKGTPEQMLAQLKNAGVKQAEIEATGLLKFLGLEQGSDGDARRQEGYGEPNQPLSRQMEAGQQGRMPAATEGQQGPDARNSMPSDQSSVPRRTSVTKDEIISYLDANRVKLNEAQYTGSSTREKVDRLSSFDEVRAGQFTAWDRVKIVKRLDEFATEQGLADSFEAAKDDLILRGRSADGWTYSEGVVPVWDDADGRYIILTAPSGRTLLTSEFGSMSESYASRTEALIELRRDAEFAARDDVEAHPTETLPGETQWSSYSLDPSNPTYRETVIHLPPSENGAAQRYFANFKIALEQEFGNVPVTQLPEKLQTQYAEAKAAADAEREANGAEHKQGFRSGHFPEPNIIGHMMTSMVKHEGKPVYLIDQIQSDWGQKLRDGGVRDEAKIAELRKRAQDAKDHFESVREPALAAMKAVDQLGFDTSGQAFGEIMRNSKWRDHFEVTDEEARPIEVYKQARQARDLLEAELRTAEASTPGHPLVNTTDQWTTTTLRRAIRQAAEADAEYIAIPTGDTVLSYNPGDENGMRGFYGRTIPDSEVTAFKQEIAAAKERGDTKAAENYQKALDDALASGKEGIVPKNLRKLLTALDKQSPAPQRVGKLDTPSKGPAGSGFTLFPLTDKVKASVREQGQAMFAFGGERAKTADLTALATAKEMDGEGIDRTRIWTETGWFKGVDGKWRFEIDDRGIIANPGDPLFHPGFSANYPEFQFDSKVTHNWMAGGGMAEAHEMPSGRAYMEVSAPRGERESVAAHEFQHAIQSQEGFIFGGNPNDIEASLASRRKEIADLVAQISKARNEAQAAGDRARAEKLYEAWLTAAQLPNRLNREAFETYQKLAGEVEARTVQKRLDYTPEQRRSRPPWEDYDVPESEQIVRMSSPQDKAMFAMRGYHGTDKDVERFNPSARGNGSGSREGPLGVWFTNNAEVASNFAEWASKGGFTPPRVIPADLDFKNPLVVGSYREIQDIVDRHTKFKRPGMEVGGRQIRMVDDAVDYEAARKTLIDMGYDGIILRNTLTDSPDGATPIDQYVAIKPGTVRSTTSGDLMFAMGDGEPEPRPPLHADMAAVNRLENLKMLAEACA